MTTPFQFPTALDHLAAELLQTELPAELPCHGAVLDAFLDVLRLDEQLLDPDIPALDEPRSPKEQIERFTGLLAERLAAGLELVVLLSAGSCACNGTDDSDSDGHSGGAPDNGEDGPEFLSCPGDRPQPPGIVHTVLGIFAELGDPDALASVDLVAALRTLPGTAEGRWRYADLTPARLAHLLAPYEVQSRDITLPDGRRRKAYRRAALLAAAHR
ncbi:DUF3631 domain-containing protein [Streptomyces sp. NPDC056716]|uniref:DUF3631 domain-containing protein n=1 Tax=unclassified Streptomyces TaxID=2593676 RepID=UPI0036822F31